MPLPLFIKPAGFGFVVEQGDGLEIQVDDSVVFTVLGTEFEVNGIVFKVD